MKTLNNQYKLIKEGKGHKGVFLTEAKKQFPQFINNSATFNDAANILKQRGIINENIVGILPINNYVAKEKESYEVAFTKFLDEAKKKEVKSQEESEKAEIKKPSKQVEEDLDKIYDGKDDKNIDNMIFDQVMAGYYAEMKDPKNEKKTMQELKDIVLKNLSKDPIHYVKDGQFGVKGLGYTKDAPGLGEPKEPKGKYKASGYGDLNENKNMNIQEQKLRKVINTIIREELAKSPLNENVDKRLKEIESEAALEVMGSKLEKITAEIEKRQMRLGKLDEDEDLKALMDKKATSKIQKEIKLLEKAKSKVEKIMGKNKSTTSKVIDESGETAEDAPDDFKAAIDKAEELYDELGNLEDVLVQFPDELKGEIERHLKGAYGL